MAFALMNFAYVLNAGKPTAPSLMYAKNLVAGSKPQWEPRIFGGTNGTAISIHQSRLVMNCPKCGYPYHENQFADELWRVVCEGCGYPGTPANTPEQALKNWVRDCMEERDDPDRA